MQCIWVKLELFSCVRMLLAVLGWRDGFFLSMGRDAPRHSE